MGTRCVLHLYLALKLEVFIDDMLVRFDYGDREIESRGPEIETGLDFLCYFKVTILLALSGS